MLDNLYKNRKVKSRAICAENFRGEKGKGGMATEGYMQEAARYLGQKWKVSPAVNIAAHTTFEMANITESGVINHIWITMANVDSRMMILRMYWDDCEVPAVESPIGDFFAAAKEVWQVSSLAVCVNSDNAYNCYWKMPFKKSCRMTIENLSDNDAQFFYQVDYELSEVPEDALYFHAQFRRVNTNKFMEDITIVEGIEGSGNYVGTYMLWSTKCDGWWGEGEIKFFMDGDTEFPTICGTGTEDYFCGAYGFLRNDEYISYSTPYAGFYALSHNHYLKSQQRFSLYRWHVTDPVHFDSDLKVTMQALGWRDGCNPRAYLPLQEDVSSVAYFYLDKPSCYKKELPSRMELEIN